MDITGSRTYQWVDCILDICVHNSALIVVRQFVNNNLYVNLNEFKIMDIYQKQTEIQISSSEELKMKRNSRILAIWATMIFLWACCIVMTCLFIKDSMCVEDELCHHMNDVILPDNSKLMIPYKEIYDYIPIDEINDIVNQQVTHKRIVLSSKINGKSWGIPEGNSIFDQLSCPGKIL